jgi:outer membrane lipoprotein-sorting protein
VRADGKDKNDKTVSTYALSDVKLDTEVAPDRFVFKAPEGVEVIDVPQNTGTGNHP